jgi:hypothetical protein
LGGGLRVQLHQAGMALGRTELKLRAPGSLLSR